MTFIGKHLPELVPFMEEPYTPQAVNQARNAFKKKVRKSSATFFYGAMCGFFTTDELDDLLFEASEVARFLLEVEGTTLDIDEEIDIEDRITTVMRGVGEAAKTILRTRGDEGAAGDRTEPSDTPGASPGQGTQPPGHSGISENRNHSGDPIQPATVPGRTDESTPAAERPDRSTVPGTDTRVFGTGELSGTKEPADGDHTGAAGPDQEES
jgi:hypothetical protein